MSLATTVVFEVRATGLDTNGGGFVPGASGVDYSQQDTPQYQVTDAVTAGSTTITSATANFGTDVVGNLLYIQGGTGGVVASVYEIISRTNSSTIVVDRSTGLTAGTGATLRIGGAFGSPGWAAGVADLIGAASTCIVWIRAGTYLITTTTAGVSNGRAAFGSGSTTGTRVFGYGLVRGDNGAKPVLRFGLPGSSTYALESAWYGRAHNIAVDGNSQTFSNGLGLNPGALASDVEVYGVTGFGIAGTDNSFGLNCVVRDSAVTAGIYCGGGTFMFCESYGLTAGSGFSVSSGSRVARCLSYGHLAGSSDGFIVTESAALFGCVAYGNGRDGFRLTTSDTLGLFVNCIAEGNAGWGFRHSGPSGGNLVLKNCAYYNNTLGTVTSTTAAIANDSPVTGTASFFKDAAAGNFALNEAAGGGLLLRGTGYGEFMRKLTTSMPDIGAAENFAEAIFGSLIN